MRETTDVRVRKLAIIGAVREALQECGISHESCIIADDAATRAISDLFALEPAPKAGPQIMFVCDYCSEHNPEMCGYYDAVDVRRAPNGQWLCETCYDEATSDEDTHFTAAPTPPSADSAQDVGELEREAAAIAATITVGNFHHHREIGDLGNWLDRTKERILTLAAYKRSTTDGKS